MIFKLLIFFHFFSVLGIESTPNEHKIKAWIELEGESMRKVNSLAENIEY